jgi:hypothetical protein
MGSTIMLTPEILQLLGQLQMQDPNSLPALKPPPSYVYDKAAEGYNTRAGELETEAGQPMVRPKGIKENLVSGIRAFTEGMANTRDPFAGINRRQDLHRESQAQLLQRAKEARASAAQQQQMGATATDRAADETYRQETLGLQRRSAELAEKKAGAPTIDNVGPGTTQIVRDPFTGEEKSRVSTPAAAKTDSLSNYSKETVNYKGKATDILVDIDPGSPTKGREFLKTPEGLVDITGQTEHYESPAKYSEPMQTVFNPDTGKNELVRRGEVRSGSAAAQPPGVLQEQRGLTASAGRIEGLGGLFSEDFVGPDTGRVLAVKAKLPEWMASLPPGYAEFAAAEAEMKNDLIKLITGAQMSAKEEGRILAQAPVSTDRSDVWKAKYARTLARAKMLEALIDRQVGAQNVTLEQLDQMIDQQNKAPKGGAPGTPATGGMVKPGGAVEALLKRK